MSNGKAKGGGFEREVCTALSQWWAGRDDVFWRSTSSGARATTRSKKGKATKGQNGDVAAIDAVGNSLIDVLTIEIKRGYNAAHIHDILDKTDVNQVPQFLKFIIQAHGDHKKAGSHAWAIVHRRDRRNAWIYFPDYFFGNLRDVGAFQTYPAAMVTFSFVHGGQLLSVGGCSLSGFLSVVTPAQIRQISREF